jgi:pyridoxine 5-phosphate synthase
MSRRYDGRRGELDVRLGVNIDHVATLRQARRGMGPDPIYAAFIAEAAGADMITVHLREDRRHIQDRDLRLLRLTVFTAMNLEMALAEPVIRIALDVRPEQVTFVPERRQEVTTEGGLDVVAGGKKVAAAARRFHARGIKVSLFIDPDPAQVKASGATGADMVELHTGAYANARTGEALGVELERLRDAARLAAELGLRVCAGHGLNYHNVLPVAGIPEIVEVNIGHSIISRAVFSGLEAAVGDMKRLLARQEHRHV